MESTAGNFSGNLTTKGFITQIRGASSFDAVGLVGLTGCNEGASWFGLQNLGISLQAETFHCGVIIYQTLKQIFLG